MAKSTQNPLKEFEAAKKEFDTKHEDLAAAIEEFQKAYEDLQGAKKDVAGFLREAAAFLDQNKKSLERGKVATSTVSLVGGGLSITAGSLMLTAASGGLAIPFLIAGAAVGVVGGVGSIANTHVKDNKKKDQIGAADFAISMYNEKRDGLFRALNNLTEKEGETKLSEQEKEVFVKRTVAIRSIIKNEEMAKKPDTKEDKSVFSQTKVFVTDTPAGNVATAAATSINTGVQAGKGLEAGTKIIEASKDLKQATEVLKSAKAAGEGGVEAAKAGKLLSKTAFEGVSKEGAKELTKGFGKAAAGLTIGLSAAFAVLDIYTIASSASELYNESPAEAAEEYRRIAKKLLPDEDAPEREHKLSPRTFKSPTYCHMCKLMLMGLYKQGLECSGCGFNYHVECESSLKADCSGIAEARAQAQIKN